MSWLILQLGIWEGCEQRGENDFVEGDRCQLTKQILVITQLEQNTTKGQVRTRCCLYRPVTNLTDWIDFLLEIFLYTFFLFLESIGSWLEFNLLKRDEIQFKAFDNLIGFVGSPDTIWWLKQLHKSADKNVLLRDVLSNFVGELLCTTINNVYSVLIVS